jgi:hypothetical protein
MSQGRLAWAMGECSWLVVVEVSSRLTATRDMSCERLLVTSVQSGRFVHVPTSIVAEQHLVFSWLPTRLAVILYSVGDSSSLVARG